MSEETRMRHILGWSVRSTPPEEETVTAEFKDVVAARIYANARPILDTVVVEPLYEIIGENKTRINMESE